SLRTGSRRHRISTVFQIPGRRADSLRIGRYTNFLDITAQFAAFRSSTVLGHRFKEPVDEKEESGSVWPHAGSTGEHIAQPFAEQTAARAWFGDDIPA
ncbi:MAG: hypothetical protein U0I69_03505, partial [Collinsella sp.]|nr:hypothetical protein [Collinsella sp.]